MVYGVVPTAGEWKIQYVVGHMGETPNTDDTRLRPERATLVQGAVSEGRMWTG